MAKTPKLAKKSNCCPVIKLVCHMTKERSVKETYRDQYTGATKTATLKVPPRRVCAVALGTRVVTGALAPNKAGSRINSLRKQLKAKGCDVKVDVSAAGRGKVGPVAPPAVAASVPTAVAAKLTRKAVAAQNKFMRQAY